MFVKQEVAMKKAAIVMGSDSDLGKVKSAALTLKELGIPFEMRIISAHRTPAEAAEFATHDPEPDVSELWTDILKESAA